MRRRCYLGYALSLGKSFASATLFTGVFLFSHLTLMLVELEFIYLCSADLRYLKVSHLLSAHVPSCPPVRYSSA